MTKHQDSRFGFLLKFVCYISLSISIFSSHLASSSEPSALTLSIVKRSSRAHGRHVGLRFLRQAFCPFLQPWTTESRETCCCEGLALRSNAGIIAVGLWVNVTEASRERGLSGKSRAEKQEGRNKQLVRFWPRRMNRFWKHGRDLLGVALNNNVRVRSLCVRLGCVDCNAVNLLTWEIDNRKTFCWTSFLRISYFELNEVHRISVRTSDYNLRWLVGSLLYYYKNIIIIITFKHLRSHDHDISYNTNSVTQKPPKYLFSVSSNILSDFSPTLSHLDFGQGKCMSVSWCVFMNAKLPEWRNRKASRLGWFLLSWNPSHLESREQNGAWKTI